MYDKKRQKSGKRVGKDQQEGRQRLEKQASKDG